MSKSKAKGEELHCTKSFFAYDSALLAHSAQDLQTHLKQFSSSCSNFGLTISLKKKTKVLSQGTDIPPPIRSMARISKI